MKKLNYSVGDVDLFSIFFAAQSGPKRRADGKGGLLKTGYYWKAGGPVHGPFPSCNAASRDAFERVVTVKVME